MRGQQIPQLPQIPGYEVFMGRTLLHARHEGRPADARQEGRPWHVVAPSPRMLVEAVNRSLDRPGGP